METQQQPMHGIVELKLRLLKPETIHAHKIIVYQHVQSYNLY